MTKHILPSEHPMHVEHQQIDQEDDQDPKANTPLSDPRESTSSIL
jgi:hypothetical protein